MSVIGDAFVAIHPQSAGFAAEIESQLKGVSLAGAGEVLGATAVAGVVVGLAKIGQMFGSARVQIQRETGDTGKLLDDTFNTVKSVMQQVPESIGAVTSAVDELQRRGVPLGATFDTLAKQELDLARLTKTDLAANVETTTAIFAKFNVPLKEQPAALDAIFKGYQQSGKGLTDLTGALLAGGASLTQFGFNIGESTALIAGLEAAGVNVQPALAGLRKAFGTIAKEGGDPKKALADLIAEFTDGTPKTKALSDAVKLFGTRSGVELATAIQRGKFNVQDMLEIITDGKGGIDATAVATRTFGEQLDILKNRALVALQPIGSAVWLGLRGAILSAVEPVQSLVEAFVHVAQALAPVGIVIGVLAAVGFAALLQVVTLVAKGVSGIASALDHFPAPVLIAAAAIGVLVKAFLSTAPAAGELTSAAEVSAIFAQSTRGVAEAVTEAAAAHEASTTAIADSVTAYEAATPVIATSAEAHAAVAAVIGDEIAANTTLIESQQALFDSAIALEEGEGQLALLFPEMAVEIGVYESALADLAAVQAEAAAAAAAEAEALAVLVAADAAATGPGIIAGIGAALGGLLNPIVLVIGGLALLGAAFTLFGSHANAAAQEAKDLSGFLFAAAGSATLYATNITSAAAGFSQFLQAQDAKHKVNDLDNALKGTALTFDSVSKAVTGNEADFRGLQQTLADQLHIPAVAVAFAEMSVQQQSVLVQTGKVNGTTIDLANTYSKAAEAVGKQRDAFIGSSEAQIQLVGHTSAADAALAAQAETIAHATSGTRGYGAALDFLNEALSEQAAKQDEVKLASAAFAPSLNDLKSQIIQGTITTNDAATASANWGLSLAATKKVISDTDAALKSFVSGGLAGLPGSSDAVNSWSQNVQAAFTAVSQAGANAPKIDVKGDAAVQAAQARLDAAQASAGASQQKGLDAANARLNAALAKQAADSSASASVQASDANRVVQAHAAVASAATKSSSAVTSASNALQAAYAKAGAAAGQSTADQLKAQQALQAALDPANVVKKVQDQAAQIEKFQTNILALVQKFPNAARALLEDPNKEAAAAFAQSLVNNPAIAAQFDTAQSTLQHKTADLKALLEGPLAQQFLAGGKAVGTAVTTGINSTIGLAPVVNAQTTAALKGLDQQELFQKAAGNLGAVATIEMQRKMILANIAQSQTAGATQAITDGTPAAQAAAGTAGAAVAGSYATGVNGIPAAATAAVGGVSAAFFSPAQQAAASQAAVAGTDIGAIFAFGISQGMGSVDAKNNITVASQELAALGVKAVKDALGIKSPSTVGIALGANFSTAIAAGVKSGATSIHNETTRAFSFVPSLLTGGVHATADSVAADVRVVNALLAQLKTDEALVGTKSGAAQAAADLKNLQAAYAELQLTQRNLQPLKVQLFVDTTLANDALAKFKSDQAAGVKGAPLAVDLTNVQKAFDAVQKIKDKLKEPLFVPPIPVDFKLGRLPEVPQLQLGQIASSIASTGSHLPPLQIAGPAAVSAPNAQQQAAQKKEVNVKVELHKVDPPDPHDLAHEIGWVLS